MMCYYFCLTHPLALCAIIMEGSISHYNPILLVWLLEIRASNESSL